MSHPDLNDLAARAEAELARLGTTAMPPAPSQAAAPAVGPRKPLKRAGFFAHMDTE